MSARPDFMIIGAMKSATTSLHAYLQSHPGVFMPVQKELNFFSDLGQWARGPAFYEGFFDDAASGAVTGEASPDYSKFPEIPSVAERIAETLPSVKYIYCYREPIDRMVSHYLHEVTRSREHRPIDVALRADDRYLMTSSYGLQLERHMRNASPDRFLVIDADRLRTHRVEVLREVYAFVGVDPDWRGFEALPELYASHERLQNGGPALWLAQTRLTARLRRRTSPRAKRAVQLALAKVTPARHARASVVEELSPVLRSEIEDKLAPDQAQFEQLRRSCWAWHRN